MVSKWVSICYYISQAEYDKSIADIKFKIVRLPIIGMFLILVNSASQSLYISQDTHPSVACPDALGREVKLKYVP